MLEGILTLRRGEGRPLPEQIYLGIRKAVNDGRLLEGARLPSSRELSQALGVSRNSANAAYELLKAEGVVKVRPGAAPRVARRRSGESEGVGARGKGAVSSLSRRGLAFSTDLRSAAYVRRAGRLQPGAPAEDLFPRDEWALALRRAARGLKGAGLLYDQTNGLQSLRETLARYLSRDRGVICAPEQIIVTASTQSSLHLLSQCLADPGDEVWIEDPGYIGARSAFLAAGLSVTPVPVDLDGCDFSSMFTSRTGGAKAPKLIYVTPSHQYPLGGRMPLERRIALLDYARRVGALVLEDDYDSEFLFSGRSIASLQGLGVGGEVVYLGTFAKSMLPALRTAYMVVPDSLVSPLAQAQRNMGALANAHTQAALADFIENGRYRAHLKRIRAVYEQRGRELSGRLHECLGDHLRVASPRGGVQLTALFRRPLDERPVIACAAKSGFSFAALSSYCLRADLRGLVIGFANASARDIREGVEVVARAMSSPGACD